MYIIRTFRFLASSRLVQPALATELGHLATPWCISTVADKHKSCHTCRFARCRRTIPAAAGGGHTQTGSKTDLRR